MEKKWELNIRKSLWSVSLQARLSHMQWNVISLNIHEKTERDA